MKHSEPSILLVDIDAKVANALTNKGYNIEIGTYGYPYRCNKSSYAHLVRNAKISSLQEKDIVFIEMTTPDVQSEADGNKVYVDGEYYLGDPEPYGIVDPRGFHMVMHSSKADKALDGGAIFVIFTHYHNQFSYYKRHENYQPSSVDLGNQLPLEILNRYVVFNNEQGKFIKTVWEDGPLTNAFKNRLQGSRFFSTFEVFFPHKEDFIPIATNKSGENVAGVLTRLGSEKNGMIFLLPQISDKAGFLIEMIEDVLPSVRPDLFPYLAKPHWREYGEYDMPIVSGMRRDIQAIKEEAEKKIAGISQRIEDKREETSYLLDLLTGNDTLLAAAVKRTLETLGFQPIDSDEELAKAGDTRRFEDLHIDELGKSILLVEAKGVSHKVSDEDALAVGKYLRPRMKLWERLDIVGLSIINQHRGTPPLQRDNDEPFRPLVLTNAEDGEIGLMTSFDLYRLCRSYINQGWRPENVKPLFYQKGRIYPVPTHYRLLGTIEGFLEKAKAVGIRIDKGALKRGDRIAYELPLEFVEQDADSLQVNGDPVETIEVGSIAGVLTAFSKVEMQKGVKVCLVTA